jgi:predicted histone-like DNA-binding protein
MRFRLVKRVNPQKKEESKWYANPVNTGTYNIKDFSKDIEGRSSLTRGDIENVLTNFTDEIPKLLKIGMSVKLGEFGTLRLTLSSEGTENKEDFNVYKIKGAKVIFTPSPELKSQLQKITLEEEK